MDRTLINNQPQGRGHHRRETMTTQQQLTEARQEVEILAALVACYFDPKSGNGSTVPFVGTMTDAQIRALWLAAAKLTKKEAA